MAAAGPVGNLTTVVQDPTPSPTDGQSHLNRTTRMSYDICGHVLSSLDPNGNTSYFSYNTFGQPTQASFPASGATPGETVAYTYGANGRTQSVSDNRGTTTMTYEAGSDRVSSVTDPVTDPVTGPISYTYAITGERLTMTLPGGGTWTYGYAGAHGTAGIDNTVYDVMLPKDDPNETGCRV